ncbi:MAG: biotin/lipoyl-binding protein [Chloroflexi bacterium]|nr:biotin/lipoyl-binding protein [Chloroflexota bacterium]
MIYSYQHQNETYSVNLERQPDGTYTAAISDSAGRTRRYHFAAQRLAHGWRLQLEDRVIGAYTAAVGDERFVFVGGETLTLRLPDKRRRRGASSAGAAAALTAQMPAQVTNVLVAAGDTVTRGQTLLLLEAMKMEIRMAAPLDGTVSRVSVHKGQVVERGQTLVEIE